MKSSSPQLQTAIIGGGPAGLMAAEQLAHKGFAVTVYDQMATVGRKLLMAGRGGLNLTHSESPDRFKQRYGSAASWLAPAIDAFPAASLRAWCHALGHQTFVGSSGRVFPHEFKTSPLLRSWLKRLDGLGVRFALRHRWHGWDPEDRLIFTDDQGREKIIHADAGILALGGASWPRLGSDGNWVSLLRREGIQVTALKPSNCGFIVPWSDYVRERFRGQPLKPIRVSFEGTEIQGEAMITEHGLEGGVIYALSSALRTTLEKKASATILIDLRPGLSREELILRLQAAHGSQSTSNYLRKAAGLSPVAIGLMRESLNKGSLPEHPDQLATLIKALNVTFTSPAPITRAISSAGGISAEEINAHFMLKKKPGFFAIGEMLDWEAPTGGYLLQASFSMAVAAAHGLEAYLKA